MSPAEFPHLPPTIIGTIGFSYADWQPTFYPPSIKSADFLQTYSTAFQTVELDTTFYGPPPPERVQKWANAVPPNFLFCPKTPRAITHDLPLPSALPPMRAFLNALAPLRELPANHLGPILLQFPHSFLRSQAADLGTFLRALPADYRYAVEFRHPSWQHADTAKLLSAHRCAWVAADYAAEPFVPPVTTDFLYLRFIGIHKRFKPYDHERLDMTDRLQWWLEQMEQACAAASQPLARAFAFFSDDFAGHAPASANRFRKLLGQPASLPTSPAPSQPSLF